MSLSKCTLLSSCFLCLNSETGWALLWWENLPLVTRHIVKLLPVLEVLVERESPEEDEDPGGEFPVRSISLGIKQVEVWAGFLGLN